MAFDWPWLIVERPRAQMLTRIAAADIGKELRVVDRLVVSVDGACSGRRCACAAILMCNGRIVAEASQSVPLAGGYVLGAEIAAVALAAQLADHGGDTVAITIETDNPMVPRVIAQGYRPPQSKRIPSRPLAIASAFAQRRGVTFNWLPRNATPGLLRAHRLASRRLWAFRRRRCNHLV